MSGIYDRSSTRIIYASRAGVPAISSLSSPQSGPDGTAALQALCNLNGNGGSLAGQSIEIVIDLPVLCNQVTLNCFTTIRGLGNDPARARDAAVVGTVDEGDPDDRDRQHQ